MTPTMNRSLPTLGTLPAVLLALACAGCATDQEYDAYDDFGDSVRHMIALQTNGAGTAGTGLDGAKAAAVLRAYRGDVAEPKRAEQPLRIEIGD